MSAHAKLLRSHYPWTSTPLISSGPMRLISTSALATAVSRANGLGFIGAGTEVSNLSGHLSSAAATLKANPIPNTPPGILPVGVGFICWGFDLAVAVTVLGEAKLKPAAVWLFAPRENKDLIRWTEEIRAATQGKTKVWIQVGTVSMALDVARSCKPDVLVIQGADAGGHGLVKSCSIISLLPECADALEMQGFGHIPLIAAGGIMDGRGVAAALTLGASGVCLGTRLLAAPEAVISDGYRKAVVEASDGGVTTARTSVYDRLRGTTGWPATYNARGVLNQSFLDCENGMADDENKRLYEEAMKMGDSGWGDQGRMTTYAGSGVGLVRKIMPAGEIVEDVLRDARNYLTKATRRSRL